jgi:hypothetical protein
MCLEIGTRQESKQIDFKDRDSYQTRLSLFIPAVLLLILNNGVGRTKAPLQMDQSALRRTKPRKR